MFAFFKILQQSPQVWQQCASINITSKDDPKPRTPLTLAPVCGDDNHGCCLELQADNKTGARACKRWSGVNTCTLTQQHCENGTQRIGIENVIHGCHGIWMPEVDPKHRCADPGANHVCGFDCRDTTDIKLTGRNRHNIIQRHDDDAPTAPRACTSYAAPGHCTKNKSACEAGCHGEWLAP